MVTSYLDTSAAFKFIADEDESADLADYVDAELESGTAFVSSWLLYAEMHCAADRRRAIFPAAVTEILDFIELVDIERVDVRRAATSSWGLRSADAIHLAVAIRVEAEVFLTYDAELEAAAARAGLRVHSPGTP